jgi:8-oxo-dGTP diphosphatase
MVAVGALITDQKTGKILLTQRHPNLDWHPGEWEITYGRIDQHEDPVEGLRREVKEEIGLTEITVGQVLRAWHLYRGPQKAENDLIGITYLVSTSQTEIKISSEHAQFCWVTVAEALELVKIDGIKADLLAYQQHLQQTKALIGREVIGVGVGAVITNDQQQILLSLRGPQARNEVGKWEIPGGAVEFGETLVQALQREIKEELDITIEVGSLVQVYDHLLEFEGQHWVSPTYMCRITEGTPRITEPDKCTQIGWFSLEEAKKLPLSLVTQGDIQHLEAHPELLLNQ